MEQTPLQRLIEKTVTNGRGYSPFPCQYTGDVDVPGLNVSLNFLADFIQKSNVNKPLIPSHWMFTGLPTALPYEMVVMDRAGGPDASSPAPLYGVENYDTTGRSSSARLSDYLHDDPRFSSKNLFNKKLSE